MISFIPNTNMMNFTNINQNQNEFSAPLSTNDFIIEKELGHGAFGYVYKVKFKRNGKYYALKQYQKDKIKPGEEIDLLREKIILYDLTKRNFPYIVQLYADFEDLSSKYLVMELTVGTKLEDLRGMDNFQGYVSQDLVIIILIQILQTLYFLHEKCNIIHRDIKPDNIILCNDNNIKLLDFGLSVYLNNPNNNLVTRHSLKGALRYVPPEIIMIEPRVYDYKIDIFSLGFTMYSLMNPSQNNQENNLPLKTIRQKGSITRFEQNIVNKFYDPPLINFVKSLYENNPAKRPTAFQALNILQNLLKQSIASTINFNNNIFNIFNVNPMMNKMISSSKQLRNYPNLNMDNGSNNNFIRLNSEVNIQKRTQLEEFLNPSMGKQNKIISSMKSLLQVLFRLDQMKFILYQLYNLFSNCQIQYNERVLHYFYEMMNTIQKLENGEVNLDYYNQKINEFIRIVFLNNEGDMSGTRPIILYYMMSSIFVEEFKNYFNTYQNYILDDYIKTNYFIFNNIIPMNNPQVFNSISQTIFEFKNNYKGPFVDNFDFLILSVSICPKCSSFFGCRCKVCHFLQLDVPNPQNDIAQLINDYFSLKIVYGDKYSCCCGFKGQASRRIFCLNLPNYLFMEFEDKNYINFQDKVILSSLKETCTYQYYAGIYKYKNNSVSNFVAVIKSGNGYILCNDDKIGPCQPNMVNLECPSLAVYKKIVNK
jgi:serine/threonine protein kinase